MTSFMSFPLASYGRKMGWRSSSKQGSTFPTAWEGRRKRAKKSNSNRKWTEEEKKGRKERGREGEREEGLQASSHLPFPHLFVMPLLPEPYLLFLLLWHCNMLSYLMSWTPLQLFSSFQSWLSISWTFFFLDFYPFFHISVFWKWTYILFYSCLLSMWSPKWTFVPEGTTLGRKTHIQEVKSKPWKLNCHPRKKQ